MKPTCACAVVFAMAVLLIGCQQVKPQEKTLADLYPDYSVFTPATLNLGEIAVADADGKAGESIAIGKLQYSDDDVILLGTLRAAPGFTTRDLQEQIARINGPLPKVKCSTTWVYGNESIVKDDCLLSSASAMMASYQTQTKASLPAQPFLTARLAANLHEGTFYRCRYKVKGAITCQNSCACAGCVTCEFRSTDGLLVVKNVQQPSRNPDATSFTPCNSLNQCN